MFSLTETSACRQLIQLALREDLDDAGDLTSQALIPTQQRGKAVLVARAPGVLAGLPAAAEVFATVNPQQQVRPLLSDGSQLHAGDQIVEIEGNVRSMLASERIALNFVQRLSGIATLTRRYVDAVTGLPAQILDTRKTTPGWRLLEKYAVRQGGGTNHRMGLFDSVLIKDNHLAAQLGGSAHLREAVEKCRAAAPAKVTIEVEVDTLDQLDGALACAPDIILLDNMNPAQLRQAVARRNAVAPSVRLEASGGVNLDTVRAIAETGVDRISVGALTHSAPALDIAMDYLD
jgi:nicotinate-nucleotide pyrophosphorylase (carboxylating)